jgi:hypothetical protein
LFACESAHAAGEVIVFDSPAYWNAATLDPGDEVRLADSSVARATVGLQLSCPHGVAKDALGGRGDAGGLGKGDQRSWIGTVPFRQGTREACQGIRGIGERK